MQNELLNKYVEMEIKLKICQIIEQSLKDEGITVEINGCDK